MVGCVFDGVDLHTIYSAVLVYLFDHSTDITYRTIHPFHGISKYVFFLSLLKHEPIPATAILFVMTTYKGVHSFRAEQTSGVIKLLVREYVLVCILVRSLMPFAAGPCFTLVSFPLTSSYPITDQRYPHVV